jgi:hypothetical protein
MDCPTCKTAYTNEHFKCLETFVDYPENRVVQDMITRKPDVFQFLLTVLQSQGSNPARFRPVPTWFATRPPDATLDITAALIRTEDLMDMARFRTALQQINTTTWRALECETDAALMSRVEVDAYMLARFMVLSCALQLEGVNKSISKKVAKVVKPAAAPRRATQEASWKQYKVTWSETVEQQWEKAGAGQTPEYLYHGSPLANWQSIMRNGLKVTSNTAWMTTGAIMGDGIYCSDTLNVSWSYSHGGHGQTVIGVYEVWGAKQYQKQAGHFVVPAAEQILLRYLIYMPDSAHTNVAALDQSLREEWISKGSRKAEATRKKNSRVEARLRKEVEAIQGAGMRVSLWDTCQVRVWITTDGKERNVDIAIPHQFPFSAPTMVVQGAEHSVRDWTPKCTLLEALRALP